MFDHVSIGVRDAAASKRFYDATLTALGLSLLSESPGSLGYGNGSVGLWIGETPKPVAADAASGLHFCFAASDRKSVDAFHAAAVKAGGKDNGAPGLRTSYGENYYAAYVVDPDGYRLEAYCGS